MMQSPPEANLRSGNNFLRKYLDRHSPESQSSAAIAYLAALDHLQERSPEVAQSILQEYRDQSSHLKLIASENFSSLTVQLAMGNLLTDKYAEGFVQHRFYSGCDNVDAIEGEAVRLLKEIFEADHAYVQPHSGADANLVAFWAILCQRVQTPEVERLGAKSIDALSPEDFESLRRLMNQQKIMGLSLHCGGHLTHGFRHNVSGKMWQAVAYDVDPKTEIIDYAALEEQAMRERPLVLVAGYSAYPRLLNLAKLREIADKAGAVLMVDMAHFAGLVAGKVLQGDYDPVRHAQVVTSTTHKTLRGPRGGLVLCTDEFKEWVDKGCPLILGGPLEHVIAAKTVAFQEANTPDFQAYARQIVDNSKVMAEELQKEGIRLVSGGTDNHIVLFDVSSFGLTGRQAERALLEAHLTSNRNSIPFDPNGAWYTSGVRIGTPAITSLGMGTEQMREVAQIIAETLRHTKAKIVKKTGQAGKANCVTDPAVIEKSQGRVKDLLNDFPLYPELGL